MLTPRLVQMGSRAAMFAILWCAGPLLWSFVSDVGVANADSPRTASFSHTPRLGKLVSTKAFSYRSTLAAERLAFGDSVGKVLSGTEVTLRCPGTKPCYVRLHAEVQALPSNISQGNLYMSPFVAGSAVDLRLVGLVGGTQFQNEGTFYVKIQPGKKKFALYLLSYATSGMGVQTYDVEYQVFKP